MSEEELIFTALAELSTRRIAETGESKGLEENKIPAKRRKFFTKFKIQKNFRLTLNAVI